jgi:hypothetical protein
MRSILRCLSGVAASLILTSVAAAQEAPAPATMPAVETTAAQVLPAGTIIELALNSAVGSRVSKRGDRFVIRLAEDLKSGDVVVLPAGTTGEGEVTHAAPSGIGGKPGELLLAARFLDLNGQRVPLKAFKIGASGKNGVNSALMASMIIGPFALFVVGGEVLIPAGTLANAKLAADLPVTAATSAP